LLALGLLLVGMALFGVLALALRAGTLAGPLAEIWAYVSPRLGLNVGFYLRSVLADYYVLIAAGLLALPLLARARQQGTAFLVGLLALAFLIPTFIIQSKVSPRYILPMLPLLAVVAAAGTATLACVLGRGLKEGSIPRAALPAAALILVFEAALWGDALALPGRLQQPAPRPTWVETLREQGLQSTDLLVTNWPTVVWFYLGRDEFYIPLQGAYERYAYRASDAVRSIYTDSVLLQQHEDFERLVELPNPGRTVWVLGPEELLPQQVRAMNPQLWPSLLNSADQVTRTADGWVLLRLTLPRRGGPDRGP
jgi:hypothetical protein